MKSGDIVRNVLAVHNNPAVPGEPVETGCLGIIIDVRPDKWNNPPLMNYVDVMLAVDGRSDFVWCGNYSQGHFEVVG